MAVRSPTRTHVTAAPPCSSTSGTIPLAAYGHAVRAGRRLPGTHLVRDWPQQSHPPRAAPDRGDLDLVTFPIGGHLFVGQQRRIRAEASHFVQSARVATLPPLVRSQRRARWFRSAASAARPFSSSASNALRVGPYGDAATRADLEARGVHGRGLVPAARSSRGQFSKGQFHCRPAARHGDLPGRPGSRDPRRLRSGGKASLRPCGVPEVGLTRELHRCAGRTCPARQPTATPSQPSAAPAPPRPSRRRPLAGADQAPAVPSGLINPYQRTA